MWEAFRAVELLPGPRPPLPTFSYVSTQCEQIDFAVGKKRPVCACSSACQARSFRRMTGFHSSMRCSTVSSDCSALKRRPSESQVQRRRLENCGHPDVGSRTGSPNDQALAQIHPETSISIHAGHSTAVSQWVDEQSCDLGVVSHLNEDYGFESEKLYQIDGVCLMPRDHRLGRPNHCIGPADLAGEPYISFSRNDYGRSDVDEIFEKAGISRNITFKTPYSSITCSLVAQGLGVAIVNPIAAQDYRHMGIATRPVPCRR